MISFTGSTGVGVRIAEVGGGTMKRLLLELGGKGACIVFDDADLKTAIGGIASSTWALPLRPDLHGAHPGASPSAASTTSSSSELAGMPPATSRSATRSSGTRCSARSSPSAHRDRVEGYVASARDEGADRRRRRRAPRARTRASTSPRRCSPTPPTEHDASCRRRSSARSSSSCPFDDDDEADRHRQRQPTFGLYDYVFSDGHRPGLRGRPSSCAPATSASTPLQRNHEAPFGGFKHERRRPRRRLVRPPRLQRDAVHRLAGLSRPRRGRRRTVHRRASRYVRPSEKAT